MPAEYVQAAKAERQKKLKKEAHTAAPPKKNSIPGILNITSKFEPVKKPKFNTNQTQNTTTNAANQVQESPEPCIDDIDQIANQLNDTALDPKQENAKKVKKLRKKIRDIEEIEARLQSGELKSLDKEKQDKINRKKEILNEIKQLEETRKDLKK